MSADAGVNQTPTPSAQPLKVEKQSDPEKDDGIDFMSIKELKVYRSPSLLSAPY